MKDFLNKAIGLLSNGIGGLNMNQINTLKFNSTASIRPAAWLALTILAVGAFANSVQAQAWLAEDFSSLGAGTNLVVGGKCVSVGSTGFATGATG